MTGKPFSPQMAQGRAQTQLALGVIFVLSAAPTVANWVRGDVQHAGIKVVSVVLSGFVLWQVYRGSLIALYLTLALSVLGGLALMLLSPLAGINFTALLLLLVGLGFAVSGLVLYAHTPVKNFLQLQREQGA